jgi:hypothetical protein
MKNHHKIKIKIIRDDSISEGFATYLSPSLKKDGEAKALLNIEATFDASVNNKLNVKEFLIENIMHEVGHSLEEYFNLEFDEGRIEKILEKYQKKYNRSI